MKYIKYTKNLRNKQVGIYIHIYIYIYIYIYINPKVHSFLSNVLIEDAMRRDTAAPSFWSLAFSCPLSESDACREMPADPLVDLV